MEFLPCAQGNIGKKGNSYIFYYVYKIKFFGQISHCLNSSVSRATVLGLKGPKFESCLKQTSFHYFYYFFTWNCNSYVKMAVLHENVMNLIILETLKVLFSNILLKKYHSSMRCGLDKKN